MAYKTTMDEYEELAEEIKVINALVINFNVKVGRLCGKKYVLYPAYRNIIKQQSKIEEKMFKDHPTKQIRNEYRFYDRRPISTKIHDLGTTEFLKQIKSLMNLGEIVYDNHMVVD